MIDSNKFNQYGEYGLEVHGIVIHNTTDDRTALELFNYLNNECKTSQGTHFLCDSNGVVEVMPLDWKVYSTGKGKDSAFNYCISIHICSNSNYEEYKRGERNAVELISLLLEEYGLNEKSLYFHNDFNEKAYCPADILNYYGSKEAFINENFRRD